MNRRITGVVGAAVAVGLAAIAVPGGADAAGHGKGLHTHGGAQTTRVRPDNRPDPLQTRRSDLRQRAVDQLVAGKAKTTGTGRDRRIRMTDGTLVDYPVTQAAQLLTFLVDFGAGTGNPGFPENTAGPVHNQIPRPVAGDNSTYWRPDFSRQHYLDMFFNGLPDQGGESFHGLYDQMSSGRFDLQGDVSSWVTVPHPAAYYQEAVDADGDPSTPPVGDDTDATMQSFVQDSASAWYAAQRASGMSDAAIKAYLARFDVWDRNDYDGDGNYNEPDGYIDHFQAIHAGQGEEGGGATWTIWSHRAAANPTTGVDGPGFNRSGGVEIGDTGFWIRDYTTEPEDGGLGVFAHEFGHDLGLPDYYDTNANTDNSTGFWSLMSSGEWLGHGNGSVGTTPAQMGAPDKLFLGWYGDDLAVVDATLPAAPVTLGPSYHATDVGAQAVAVTLPRGSSTVDVVAPDQGTHYLYSGNGDSRTATVTSPQVTVPAADPTLTARVSYAIEDDWDYAYLEVSGDGGATWDHVPTSRSSATDPHGHNQGGGITGCSGTRDDEGTCDNAWTDLSADLSAYAGRTVSLRFAMVNDQATHQLGLSVDSIALGGSVLTDLESSAAGWTLDGFRVMDGSSYTTTFDQYYLAENRQYRGYDKTLAQGPYSWDHPVSAPTRVDQYPYQDGLLVWYANGLYADNNTSSHPGGGQALVVDANPAYQLWWTGAGDPYDYGDGRLNAYDSTFDVDRTDGLHLTKETDGAGDIHYDVDARPGVPVFEDTDPNAYWDDFGGQIGPVPGWFSTKVAGVGAEMQVVSSDESTGRMVVKVGSRFVANTSGASFTGAAAVGETLVAQAPSWFQGDVSAGYQWLADGRPLDGATSATYVVPKSILGRTISVAVVGSRAGYADTRVVSEAVKVRNKPKG